MALCTLDEIKTYRGISSSSYDTLLQLLIDSCSTWVESYLGTRKIYDDDILITEYHDGDRYAQGKRSIFLQTYPITSIIGVYYSEEDDLSNPTWTAFSDSTDYVVNPKTGEIKFFYGIGKSVQNIKVEYKGGFSAIPSDIKLACIFLVTKQFDKRKSQGITNENLGQGGIGWELFLTRDLVQILNQYRSYTFDT